MALLDAIFDGLTDEDDGALREFCAEAAREFLLWSAKHVTAKASQAGANLNAASLLRRLFERLAHPKPYQRCSSLSEWRSRSMPGVIWQRNRFVPCCLFYKSNDKHSGA